jgi:choline-sulfatase
MKPITSSKTRRQFLQTGAAGLAGLALTKSSSAAPKQAAKPNILWIMSDEHNATVAGCYGNKLASTPNIDSLAANGITFDRHYCNSPLCVPSRASITAGKYVSRVDVWGNTSELPSADIASLPRVMTAAGYDSVLCGKQHYDYTRRYGFTEIGGNMNNNYKTGKGGRRNPDQTTQKELSPRFNQFHPGDHGASVEHDKRVTAGTVDFLTHRKGADKPFFLYAGYLAPHFPLIVPDPFYQKAKGKAGMPTIPAGFLDTLPLNYKLLRASFEEIGVPDDTVQRGRELYYGLTNWVDNEFGKVLAALRSNPAIAANTVIIYSSDHGENMGEHGMWWKSCMYDTAARVPLVISFPPRWAKAERRVATSSHLDLVQTVAAIGGAKTPDDWNGESMLAWMDSPKTKWKDYAVSEYYAHGMGSGYVMARSGDWKYVYHNPIDAQHPDERQLFNLADDPAEFHNLAALPEHGARIADMHARMVKEVGGDPNETEKRSRLQLAAGYHRTDPRPAGAADEAS